MKPIGMLMNEHRLIERILALMNEELSRIREKGKADPVFIDICVDILRPGPITGKPVTRNARPMFEHR